MALDTVPEQIDMDAPNRDDHTKRDDYPNRGDHLDKDERPKSDEHIATLSPRAEFLRSFIYAFAGVRYTVRTQRNMRVHLAIAIVAVALGLWLQISPIEYALVFIVITSVIVAEMFNTVTEAIVDLATQQYHDLAKIAKDVAAGAVLLNAMLSVLVGCFIYIPHLIAWWQRH